MLRTHAFIATAERYAICGGRGKSRRFAEGDGVASKTRQLRKAFAVEGIASHLNRAKGRAPKVGAPDGSYDSAY
jgi:hypothetical protein